MNMERYEIPIKNRKYTIVFNDRTNLLIIRLKRLYTESYKDPESFDEISNAISDTINELKHAITPEPSDDDLDKIIKEIFKLTDKRK